MTSPTTTTTSPQSTPVTDSENPFRYTAAMASDIETRWQQYWSKHKTFATSNPGDPQFDQSKPKFYCLDMFPYPSGAGLHVGHPEGYTATDIICRYKRMRGCNVLHPMGWDAFGLPAEQYAIQTGVHPAETTTEAINTFRGQLQRFGFSYDWSREFATIDPDYYRWTQWIWLKAYNAWYDPVQNRARPIHELMQDLENGHAYVGPSGEIVFAGTEGETEALGGEPVGMRKWHELEPDERRDVIDNQRLAYLGEQTVNWCPKLGTVLANEEVIDGKSERGGFPVHRRPLKQWMFRITAYADRLLSALDDMDWPESTRTMQREWIGRSVGAEIDFGIADDDFSYLTSQISGADIAPYLRVFTTRPDTVFGATYMVVAPEHPLVDAVLEAEPSNTELHDYVDAARNRSDVDRMAETKQKTGVFTGVHAINPATNERIPIWTADYVLMTYGTGAIMAVPGHDERDHEFARACELPITQVIEPPSDITVDIQETAYPGDGTNINSANDEVSLNGLATPEAKKTIIDWLQRSGQGVAKVNFKLRDWLFSRQRYWGEPFPIVYDEAGNHYPVDEKNLPVRLPDLADYTPVESDDPQPLLGKATDWVHTTAGEAGVSPDLLSPDTPVTRETNTMPGWAGSCWYELRFCDPHNDDRFAARKAEQYWMPVDLYIGGAEHAVLHLLYARFWHKILYDLGEVSTSEPFQKLFHQGMIVSHAFQRDDKSLVPIDEVDEPTEGEFIERATSKPVTQVVAKMSKSLKNVVNPDDIISDYGADTFRLYEMYMGPLEASKPWNTRDINGLFRFLQRAWRLAVDEQTGDLQFADTQNDEVERALHQTIDKVGTDIERLAFNTAIAALIEFVNTASKAGGVTRDQLSRFVLTLSPFAPHLAEELWRKLGNDTTLAYEPWPVVDESMLTADEIEMPVQIMGKVRGHITVPADADAAAIEEAALQDDQVKAQLEGKTVRKVIVVPGKIVNIVAN